MTDDIHLIHSEIEQSRSRYQLERFVVGQHHTPEMQYVQIVRELKVVTDALEQGTLRAELAMAEAAELRESGLRSDEIAAELKERSAQSKLQSLQGTRREIVILEELLSRYPRYTRDEIEAAQEDYWHGRLLRVAHMQALAGGVGWAHIEALWQSGAIEHMANTNSLEALLENGRPELLGESEA